MARRNMFWTRARGLLLAVAAMGIWTALDDARALAQVPNMNLVPELKSQTPEEKERDAQADKAYRESLRKIPNQTVSDPWGDVRGAGTAKPAAAPKAAPRAAQAKRPSKTEGATN